MIGRDIGGLAMTETRGRAPRPPRRPLTHRLPQAWKRRPDPFAAGDMPQRDAADPEDTGAARNSALTAVVAAAMILLAGAALTLILTDWLR
jgi:hypothetical protein